MAYQPKTAKDLPAGSEVETFHTTITKVADGQWTNGEGNTFTDVEVDEVLGRGGMLTFVPAGRGRWLRQEQEARRG